jgi:hypothetical protein
MWMASDLRFAVKVESASAVKGVMKQKRAGRRATAGQPVRSFIQECRCPLNLNPGLRQLKQKIAIQP